MKHLSPSDTELFASLLEDTGLNVSDQAQRVLVAYLDSLIETNLSLNLTRISAPAAGIRLHLVDSLMCLVEIDEAPEGGVLDLGTGGGVPGVPVCIATGRPGVLLDSVGKKARAVNAILTEQGIHDVVAVHERAEEHALSHRQAYAVVTARAVSELPALVELASPLLMPGGRLVALKGSPSAEEIERGRQAARQVGMQEISLRTVQLPGGDERRCIVAYERCGTSRIRLPRKTGAAQRTPLA